MSQAGIRATKVKIRNLLKEAAHQQELLGHEPLTVLTSCLTDMLAEMRDDEMRKALAKTVVKNLTGMVDFVRAQKKLGMYDDARRH